MILYLWVFFKEKLFLLDIYTAIDTIMLGFV